MACRSLWQFIEVFCADVGFYGRSRGGLYPADGRFAVSIRRQGPMLVALPSDEVRSSPRRL